MIQRILVGALALLASHATYAIGIKCDHEDKFGMVFMKWYGGCDRTGLRDGDGIELYENKLSGNRTARRAIYYSGSMGSIKFEEYTWFANGNYLVRRDQTQGYGVKAKELPEWAKFVTGPKGRSPTDEEVAAVQKFRQTAPAWSK